MDTPYTSWTVTVAILDNLVAQKIIDNVEGVQKLSEEENN